MYRIGTSPRSFNDFVLLVKGVPAPTEVLLGLADSLSLVP